MIVKKKFEVKKEVEIKKNKLKVKKKSWNKRIKKSWK